MRPIAKHWIRSSQRMRIACREPNGKVGALGAQVGVLRSQIATVPVDKTAARHEIFYIKPESDDAKVKRLEQTARELRAKSDALDASLISTV